MKKKKKLFLDDKYAKERAKTILDRFLPGFDVSRMVSQLDPSEKQMVEIAKANLGRSEAFDTG